MVKIITIFVLFFSVAAVAQDEYAQNNTKAFEAEAKEITTKYNKQLLLATEQIYPFQKKVQEFLVRKSEIDKNSSGKESIDLIYGLQQTETAEMGALLTEPQLELYKKMKPKVQPLDGRKKE